MTAPTRPLRLTYDAAIQLLLDLNLQQRAFVRAQGGLPSAPVWAQECCTVIAGGGRQTGKSTWIARNIAATDLLVVRDDGSRDLWLEKPDLNIPRERIFTPKEIRATNRWRDNAPTFDRCFIDDATYVFEEIDPPVLYQWAVARGDRIDHTFFLLG